MAGFWKEQTPKERVWRKFIALLAKDEPNHPWVKKQEREDLQRFIAWMEEEIKNFDTEP